MYIVVSEIQYMLSLVALVLCIDDDTLDLGFRFLLAFFLGLSGFVVRCAILNHTIYQGAFSILRALSRLLADRCYGLLLGRLFLNVSVL